MINCSFRYWLLGGFALLALAAPSLARAQPSPEAAKETFVCQGMTISLKSNQAIAIPSDLDEQARLRQCLETFRDQLTIRAEISKTMEQIAASMSSLARSERDRASADQAARASAAEAVAATPAQQQPVGMQPPQQQPQAQGASATPVAATLAASTAKPMPLAPGDQPRILSVIGARGVHEALLQMPDGAEALVRRGSRLSDGSRIERIAPGQVFVLPPGADPADAYPLAFALPERGARPALPR